MFPLFVTLGVVCGNPFPSRSPGVPLCSRIKVSMSFNGLFHTSVHTGPHETPGSSWTPAPDINSPPFVSICFPSNGSFSPPCQVSYSVICLSSLESVGNVKSLSRESNVFTPGGPLGWFSLSRSFFKNFAFSSTSGTCFQFWFLPNCVYRLPSNSRRVLIVLLPFLVSPLLSSQFLIEM